MFINSIKIIYTNRKTFLDFHKISLSGFNLVIMDTIRMHLFEGNFLYGIIPDGKIDKHACSGTYNLLIFLHSNNKIY